MAGPYKFYLLLTMISFWELIFLINRRKMEKNLPTFPS